MRRPGFKGLAVLVAAVAIVGVTLGVLSHPSEVTIGGYTTSLEGRSSSQRHNSLLSLKRLVGATIEPGGTFSFNARVGTFSRDQGYRKAPVSYNGQLIDSWGGGVCQTSTTLYNAALLSGMEILERSRHRFAPGYVPPGRDAAVAYSSIDLKFRNPHSFPVRIVGEIKGDRLSVTIIGSQALAAKPRIVEVVREPQNPVTYTIGNAGPRARVRNTGKAGFQVTVYRLTGNDRELISSDSYPAMGRVVDYR